MTPMPRKRDQLIRGYIDLNKKFSALELDIIERLRLSANSIQLFDSLPVENTKAKHPILKTSRERRIEAALYNSDSEESKGLRDINFQNFLLEYAEEEHELELLFNLLREELLEEFLLEELLLTKEKSEEQARAEQLIQMELENYKLLARRHLEELLNHQTHLANLINQLDSAKQNIGNLISGLTKSVKSDIHTYTNELFDNFKIEGNDSQSNVINELINTHKDEFKQLGANIDENIINSSNASFDSIHETLTNNFKTLLKEKMSLNRELVASSNFNNILEKATKNFSDSMLNNKTFIQNINLKLEGLKFCNYLSSYVDNSIDFVKSSYDMTKRGINHIEESVQKNIIRNFNPISDVIDSSKEITKTVKENISSIANHLIQISNLVGDEHKISEPSNKNFTSGDDSLKQLQFATKKTNSKPTLFNKTRQTSTKLESEKEPTENETPTNRPRR